MLINAAKPYFIWGLRWVEDVQSLAFDDSWKWLNGILLKRKRAGILKRLESWIRIWVISECAFLFKLYDKLEGEGRSITATMLKDAYMGKKKRDKMVLELFHEHYNQVDQLIGQDFAAGTAERYRTARKHVEAYIRNDYKKDDIAIKDVNHKFITGFEYYLKTVRKYSHNTAIKYAVNFKIEPNDHRKGKRERF